MSLTPKVSEAVSMISTRLKERGAQTLNELHDWWVKELVRDAGTLREAVKWMVEQKLAIATTMGSTKLLRLAGEDEPAHDPPAPPPLPPDLSPSSRAPSSKPPASAPVRTGDAAPVALHSMIHDAGKRESASPLEAIRQIGIMAGAQERWLSSKEAVEYAKKNGHDVSTSAVQQWMAAHQLEHKPSGHGKARLISQRSLDAYFRARAAGAPVPTYELKEEPPRADEITIPEAARIIKKAKPTVQNAVRDAGLARRMWRGAWLYNRAAVLALFCIQEVPRPAAMPSSEGGGVVVDLPPRLQSIPGGAGAPRPDIAPPSAEQQDAEAFKKSIAGRLSHLLYMLMHDSVPPGELWRLIEETDEGCPETDHPISRALMGLSVEMVARIYASAGK